MFLTGVFAIHSLFAHYSNIPNVLVLCFGHLFISRAKHSSWYTVKHIKCWWSQLILEQSTDTEGEACFFHWLKSSLPTRAIVRPKWENTQTSHWHIISTPYKNSYWILSVWSHIGCFAALATNTLNCGSQLNPSPWNEKELKAVWELQIAKQTYTIIMVIMMMIICHFLCESCLQ